MQGRMILGWGLIIPVCFGTLALSREAALAARWLHEPHPRTQSADDVRVPTPCLYRPEDKPLFVAGLLAM